MEYFAFLSGYSIGDWCVGTQEALSSNLFTIIQSTKHILKRNIKRSGRWLFAISFTIIFCPIYQAGHAFQGFKYVLISIVIEIWMHDVKTDRNDRMVLGNVVVITCLSIHHCPLYGNLPVSGEFPTQRVSHTENVSIWWRHHEYTTSPGLTVRL